MMETEEGMKCTFKGIGQQIEEDGTYFKGIKGE